MAGHSLVIAAFFLVAASNCFLATGSSICLPQRQDNPEGKMFVATLCVHVFTINHRLAVTRMIIYE